jgi:hypothetical protein
MGVFLDGVNKNTYFQNNWQEWRRVWDFVVLLSFTDVLTSEDIEAGRVNQCHLLDENKVQAIAQRLREALNNKPVFEKWIEISRDSYKDIKGKCRYSFSWQNVQDFAEFCEKSGGFRIC